MDGIRLLVQVRFLLPYEQHFINQTVQFSIAFLKNEKITGKVIDGINAMITPYMLSNC